MSTKLIAERCLHVIFAALLIAALLAACSGGDVEISAQGPVIDPTFPPVQTSESIKAQGAITGLGGVTINNVRYVANNATVTLNGFPGTLSDLRHGQVVTVAGSIDSDGLSGRASAISFDANIIGPIESLDAARGQLAVMGQTVITDSGTLFDDGIDPASFAGLSIGTIVQVSGFANASGQVAAMRIDPAPANGESRVIGEVADLDFANLRFSVNDLSVDYSSALVIDLPGGAPANGMTVLAIGDMSGGRLSVERLAAAPDLSGNTGSRVQAAGFITRFNSPTDFDINGLAAAINSATVFFNGSTGDLALNTELVIDGNFAANGHITANRITIGHVVNATATLEYDFQNFTEISVPTVFNVTVTQGSTYSVEVVVDGEAANRIDVTQSGSTLNIALLEGNGNIETLEAYITMPVLDRMDLTGVVFATLTGFDQAQMDLRVAGVSQLVGDALTIDDLTATVAGVSRLDLGDIRPIGNANIDIGGVSQATLNMDVGSTLAGSLNTGQGTGVSTLYYYGTNVVLDVTTDGISSIVHLGATRP
jgi:hypothetical protein